MMISEGELLQANATIIVGILIFLTLAPISRGQITQIVEKKKTLTALIIILLMVAVSTWALLLPAEPWIPSFLIARIFSLLAVAAVVGLVLGLYYYYPKLNVQQKGEDQG